MQPSFNCCTKIGNATWVNPFKAISAVLEAI